MFLWSPVASFTPVEQPFRAQFRKLGLILVFLKIAALFYQNMWWWPITFGWIPFLPRGKVQSFQHPNRHSVGVRGFDWLVIAFSVQRFLKFVGCRCYILRCNYHFLFWGQKLIIMADFTTRDVTVCVVAPVVTFMLEVHSTHTCSFKPHFAWMALLLLLCFFTS